MLAQYGAWLCGMCLGAASMALHHKLCHVLGGAFDLPHAETHAVVLPYAAAYNARRRPPRWRAWRGRSEPATRRAASMSSPQSSAWRMR